MHRAPARADRRPAQRWGSRGVDRSRLELAKTVAKVTAFGGFRIAAVACNDEQGHKGGQATILGSLFASHKVGYPKQTPGGPIRVSGRASEE